MRTIICHNDPDGWVSAYLVSQYLKSNYKYVLYDYDMNVSDIEGNLGDGDIYMVDCTLPDSFMEKYADRIHLYDHHASRINDNNKWVVDNHSNITLDKFYDLSEQQAKQISACELVWMELFSRNHLFGQDDMPPVVRLTGRYDVWDHNEDVLNLHAYIENNVSEKLPMEEAWFTDLFNNYLLQGALEEGKLIRKILERKNAKECASSVFVQKVLGYDIAIANHTGGSKFFDSFVKNSDVVIDGFLMFSFNGKVWKVSCYSNTDTFEALSFLQDLAKSLSVVSIGGHKNACGMVLKPRDIFDLFYELSLLDDDSDEIDEAQYLANAIKNSEALNKAIDSIDWSGANSE